MERVTIFQTTEMTHCQCSFTRDPLKLLQRDINILIRHLKIETKKSCLFIALGANLSSYCISNSTLTQTNKQSLVRNAFKNWFSAQGLRGLKNGHTSFLYVQGDITAEQTHQHSAASILKWISCHSYGELALLVEASFSFLGKCECFKPNTDTQTQNFLWCHNQ